jgi:hypothetical protein
MGGIMRAILLAALLAVPGSVLVHAQEQPPTAPPKAPTTLVIIACRVDDMTGQPGRHGVDADGVYHPEQAAHGWRDLELKVIDGEYSCKREVTELEDNALYSPLSEAGIIPLNPDFSDLGQCAHAGASMSTAWDQAHPGWGTVAIGCPVPIMDKDRIIGWKLPECPVYKPGTYNPETGEGERMKCRFDASAV